MTHDLSDFEFDEAEAEETDDPFGIFANFEKGDSAPPAASLLADEDAGSPLEAPVPEAEQHPNPSPEPGPQPASVPDKVEPATTVSTASDIDLGFEIAQEPPDPRRARIAKRRDAIAVLKEFGRESRKSAQSLRNFQTVLENIGYSADLAVHSRPIYRK